MARPLIAELAPGIVCAPDYVIRVTAVNPTTGAVVSGVVVSDVSIHTDQLEIEDEGATPSVVVPIFAYAAGG